MQKIAVGLIGFGLAGEVFHAPLIQSTNHLKIQKVRTSQEEKVYGALGHKVEVVTKIEKILQDPEIQLVVIASPNSTHYELAKAALQSGKHVVVDKPFVTRVEQGRELIQLSKQKGLFLSVFHNRRWDSDFLTVSKLIKNGEIGEVHSFSAHFDRYRPQVKARWKEQDPKGAGVLYDLGSHLIDQALVLFGKPEAVYADVYTQRPGAGAPDGFMLTLYYPNNRKVYLRSNSLILEPGPRFEVHGSHGSFLKYGLDGQEEALKNGLRPGNPSWGVEPVEYYGTLTKIQDGKIVTERIESELGRYEVFYQQIERAILGEVEMPVDPQDALDVIQVIEAAMQSSREKRVILFA